MEILLALAILGIGLVGILATFVVGANTVRRTVVNTEASLIAQLVFEDLKRQGHANINNVTNANVPSLPSVYTNAGYTVNANCTNAGAANLSIKNVNLTINRNNVTVSNFETYITKYAP